MPEPLPSLPHASPLSAPVYSPEVIAGESVTVMRDLAAAGRRGTVKLAYLDPPYNGRRSTDVGYRDHRTTEAWSKMLSDVASATRELMRPDGSLWLHLPDRQAARGRAILDEIFAESNFVGSVYWERTRRPSHLAKHLASTIDPIAIYARDAKKLAPFTTGTTEPGKRVPLAHRGNRAQDLVFPPGSVRFGVPDGHYPAADHSTASVSATLTADLLVEDGRNATAFCLRLPSRYSAARVNQMIEEGSDFSVPQLPFRPSHTSPGGKPKAAGALWSWQLDHSMPTHEDSLKEQAVLAGQDSVPFPWAKPEGLLRRIIELSTSPGDLVLDPFAGSGTTAAAAVQLGRRCVAIEERGELVRGLIAERVARTSAHIDAEQGVRP